MPRYVLAYGAWLLGVFAMAALATAWYRHVEDVGLREVASRLRATDATEATDRKPRDRPGRIDEDPAA